jgi:hypothetical protein
VQPKKVAPLRISAQEPGRAVYLQKMQEKRGDLKRRKLQSGENSGDLHPGTISRTSCSTFPISRAFVEHFQGFRQRVADPAGASQYYGTDHRRCPKNSFFPVPTSRGRNSLKSLLERGFESGVERATSCAKTAMVQPSPELSRRHRIPSAWLSPIMELGVYLLVCIGGLWNTVFAGTSRSPRKLTSLCVPISVPRA